MCLSFIAAFHISRWQTAVNHQTSSNVTLCHCGCRSRRTDGTKTHKVGLDEDWYLPTCSSQRISNVCWQDDDDDDEWVATCVDVRCVNGGLMTELPDTFQHRHKRTTGSLRPPGLHTHSSTHGHIYQAQPSVRASGLTHCSAEMWVTLKSILMAVISLTHRPQ